MEFTSVMGQDPFEAECLEAEANSTSSDIYSIEAKLLNPAAIFN
jgi:hypothetical protein